MSETEIPGLVRQYQDVLAFVVMAFVIFGLIKWVRHLDQQLQLLRSELIDAYRGPYLRDIEAKQLVAAALTKLAESVERSTQGRRG